MAIIDEQLLDILVCPVTKKSLYLNEDTHELICEESGLAYPIKAVSYTHQTLPTIYSV